LLIIEDNPSTMSRLVLLSLCLISFSSCYIIRAYKNRNLNLQSHTKLPFVSISNGTDTFHFSAQPVAAQTSSSLDTLFPGTQTAALLIIRNDSIIYEKYFDDYHKNSLLPSFSVVKSFVGTLVAIAHKEGKIRSLQQPMTDYLPTFLEKDARFAQITIQHLLDMRSGFEWNEHDYGLKDDAIKMGFRPNITPYVYKIKIREAPGRFEYQSINTMLLAMIVENATGTSISGYLSEKLWQPLGMEYGATWNTDKHKREIAYAGLNATARDFAKFGQLYLNNGKWKGKQILPSGWVDSTGSPDIMKSQGGYKNQFWGDSTYREFADSLQAVKEAQQLKNSSGKVSSYINREGNKRYYFSFTTPIYYAQGILGQYIFINPVNRTVIVRLGYYWKHPRYQLETLLRSISENL
jgi:CubicO group peptidase (beta-lactamase class C family)